MRTGGRRRRSRLVALLLVLTLGGLVMVIAGGCGGDDPAAVSSTATASPTPSDTAQPSADGEGVLVAEEILATFDELVGEVAELAKDKPDPAVLEPQLEELYDSYVPTVTQLNQKYLALRDSDIALFGECNGYLGENRGKHVLDKDNLLSEPVRYYNLELGDQEMVSLLSEKPIELLEIAVNQG